LIGNKRGLEIRIFAKNIMSVAITIPKLQPFYVGKFSHDSIEVKMGEPEPIRVSDATNSRPSVGLAFARGNAKR
jgi:hypothetical protein